MTTNHTLPSTQLKDKAVLVRLKRGSVAAYRKDQGATALVEAHVGRDHVGNFSKHLLKHSANFKAVQQAMYGLYKYHINHTLPWLDEGLRILKATNYLGYTQEMGELSQQVSMAVRNLQQSWPQEVSADAHRLGALFNPDDYPSADRLPELFYVDLAFLPVPDTADFRVDISEEHKRSLEQAIKDAEQSASANVLAQMLEPLQRMAEKLRVPIGADGSIFRNSLTENLLETAERMERINISDDPAIARAIASVRQLGEKAVLRTDQLRDNPTVRSDTASEVEAMLANLGGLL
ncbi:MAG: hypothetical protein H7842_12550 [Gammaproteobacteria bacterium SHHR-1]